MRTLSILSALIIVGTTVYAAIPLKMSVIDVTRTAEGLLYGLLESEKPFDISQCIGDTLAFEGKIVKAVTDL